MFASVRACCLMAYQFWMQQRPWAHLKEPSPLPPVSLSKLPLGQFCAPLDHLASNIHSHTSSPLPPLAGWQSCPWCMLRLSHLLFPALGEHRELHPPSEALISSVLGQKDKIQLDSACRSVVARCLPHYQLEETLWTVKFSVNEYINTIKAIDALCVHFLLTAVLQLWLYSVLY